MRITESQLRKVIRRMISEQAAATYKKDDWVKIVQDPNPGKSMVGRVGWIEEAPAEPGAQLIVKFAGGWPSKSFNPEDVVPYTDRPIDHPFLQDQLRRQRHKELDRLIRNSTKA